VPPTHVRLRLRFANVDDLDDERLALLGSWLAQRRAALAAGCRALIRSG
jgi:hypothetical protein